jgi:serine/threonine-protein kinase
VTPERWQVVKELLAETLGRTPEEQAAYLDQACVSDPSLRREVEALLEVGQATGAFLEPPAAAAASTDITSARPKPDLGGMLQPALAERYRVERELGRGGMATVYLAQDLRHERPVALKVLHPELGAHAGAGRFLREIKLTARLEHPHILPLLDSGEADGLLWYTMPYVEGESLRARLAREAQFSVDEAVRLAREAADALEYAHSQGVVHRDIKPENILLSRGHVRVADFGIAKALEAAAGDESLTVSGFMVGTPAYMSPEQAAGGTVDARTDVYALGCVLYEMLAGEPPFTGPTPQAVIGRRFIEPPPLVRKLREDVPLAVEAALAHALATEPADRFQTAAEFAEALSRTSAVAAVTPAGRDAPPAPKSARPMGRRMPAGTALLVLGLVLALGVLFALLRPNGDGDAESDTKPLAVLPFENVGDSADAYLADGMSDAVRGKLAALSGLSVIAGASSREYRRSTKPLRQIARELGVRYLLVGRVRREKGSGEQVHLRVSAELVEVGRQGTPTTRWEEPLEVPVTNLFQVQGDVARAVAEALGVTLRPEERLQLAEPPTRNLAAYEAFLRGEQMSTTEDPAVIRQAFPYYEQAVALDSGFVEAWAHLSGKYSLLYATRQTPADSEAARAAAERALALAPDHPDAHLSLGDYYLYVFDDIRRALKQYRLGLRTAPNHVPLLASAGRMEQFLGQWEPALHDIRRAATLDPRSPDAAQSLVYVLLLLRRYADAHPAVDRALALAPANPEFAELKAMIYLAEGNLPGARSVVRAALKQADPASLVVHFGYFWDLYWVLEEPEQQLLVRLPPSAFDNDRGSWGLVMAETYHLRDDSTRWRGYADSARLAFEDKLKAAPDDAQAHALHGLSLAYLGRRADAILEGKQAASLVPIQEHSLLGPYLQHQLARIYVLVGEYDKALDQLEPLLKIPYYLSPGWLRIDPTFDPLRRHPRFQRLLQSTA